jgi:excisionase family DNA binding protein
MPHKSAERPKAAASPAELIPIKEAAARYHLHHTTLRKQIAEGHLTGYMLGPRVLRVDPDEVAALFRVRKGGAA